jgi:hypothetical protein
MNITLGNVAEVVAVISIIAHFYQHFKHKTEEKIMLGFLHGLKPLVESSAADQPIPAQAWAGAVNQINDMLSRLQPPRKKICVGPLYDFRHHSFATGGEFRSRRCRAFELTQCGFEEPFILT